MRAVIDQAYSQLEINGQLDLNQFPNLIAMFHDAVTRFADKPAFTSLECTLTYGDLDRLSRDFGAYLQAQGYKPGERIAMQLPNIIQYPVALFGALRV